MYVDNFPRLSRLMMCCAGLVFSFTHSHSVGTEAILVHGKSKLSWTKNDNGQDINWSDAMAFCAKRGAGWRLPHADELVSLYADAEREGDSAACGGTQCKVSPQFKLSGNWYWTDTPVTREEALNFDALGWGVLLSNGKRTQTFKFMSYNSRALCVQAP